MYKDFVFAKKKNVKEILLDKVSKIWGRKTTLGKEVNGTAVYTWKFPNRFDSISGTQSTIGIIPDQIIKISRLKHKVDGHKFETSRKCQQRQHK